jgi:hypothetical protein
MTGRDDLGALHSNIESTYRAAREGWRDVVATDFDRRHWGPIDEAAQDLMMECERFEEALDRAESALGSRY